MQESGKSIQSYPELGLKLLSQALLSYGDKKNDAKLKAAQQTDLGNETTSMLAGLTGASPAPADAPAASMAFASEQDPSLTSAPTSAPITSSPLAPVAAPKSSRDLDLLARTLIGEAGNQGDQGQQAVAQVIKNRADKSGMTIPDVIMAKGQFEPWGNPKTRAKLEGLDPNSPQYQAALTNAQAVMGGTAQLPPNVAGADHFYSPTAQAALGRPNPSWDNGTGADLGQHRFLSLGYNAPPGYQPQGGQGQPPPQGGMPPMGQPPGPQAPAPQLSMPELAQGPQGGPQPFQVAQNGGLPPMPSKGGSRPRSRLLAATARHLTKSRLSNR
jgi:spore germination cell wall hydrolase CwlJ-like protein